MALHPLAQRFAAVAEAYERARPGHPRAVADTLLSELALGPGDPVLDLAAGTGKLTRALAAAGLDVQAVEPLERFRAILARAVAPDRVHDGLAEAIPFADGRFAAVTAADAFHWFDQDRALAEIGRVLRPGGGLALLAVLPDVGDEVAAVVEEARGEHPFYDRPGWPDILRAAPGWTSVRQVAVVTRQTLAVAAYVATFSWVTALPGDERSAVLARVRAIAGDEPVELEVRTEITLAARG